MSNDENFDFVIAKKWYPDDPDSSLCIYTYGSEIQQGNMEEAQSFLDYVKMMTEFDNKRESIIKKQPLDPNEYKIYKVTFTLID